MKMAKKKEKKEEKQPEITSEQIIESMKGDYTNLLTYAQSLEKTVQDLRQKIEVYEAMQTQLLGDKKELKSYILSLENTLNQARQSTQS